MAEVLLYCLTVQFCVSIIVQSDAMQLLLRNIVDLFLESYRRHNFEVVEEIINNITRCPPRPGKTPIWSVLTHFRCLNKHCPVGRL
jgi:hypothetical protein